MNEPHTGEDAYWLGSQVIRPTLEDDPVYRWFQSKEEEIKSSDQLINIENPSGSPTEFITKIGAFSLHRCQETGFVYANPRLSTSTLVEYFTGNNAAEYFDGVERGLETRHRSVYSPQAEYLKERLPRRARVLEVGCGTGGFLETLRDEAEFEVTGIEIAPGARKYQRRRNLNVHRVPIEDFAASDGFDAVVMWSVMDHFSDPMAALASCWRNLTVGGYIYVGNVNIEGFDHQIIGPSIRTFRVPSRVNFYNVSALEDQLERTGFRVIEARTPGSLDIEMVRDYWKTGGEHGRNPFLEVLLLNDANESSAQAFQRFLTENGHSGYQAILARKH